MWWNFIGRSHEEVAAFRKEWQRQRAGRTPHAPGRYGAFPDVWPHTLPAPELPDVRLSPRLRRRHLSRARAPPATGFGGSPVPARHMLRCPERAGPCGAVRVNRARGWIPRSATDLTSLTQYIRRYDRLSCLMYVLECPHRSACSGSSRSCRRRHNYRIMPDSGHAQWPSKGKERFQGHAYCLILLMEDHAIQNS